MAVGICYFHYATFLLLPFLPLFRFSLRFLSFRLLSPPLFPHLPFPLSFLVSVASRDWGGTGMGKERRWKSIRGPRRGKKQKLLFYCARGGGGIFLLPRNAKRRRHRLFPGEKGGGNVVGCRWCTYNHAFFTSSDRGVDSLRLAPNSPFFSRHFLAK